MFQSSCQSGIFVGFCTEFNVVGGVIQVHASAKCTNKFPKCDEPYLSTDAYKCKSRSIKYV